MEISTPYGHCGWRRALHAFISVVVVVAVIVVVVVVVVVVSQGSSI